MKKTLCDFVFQMKKVESLLSSNTSGRTLQNNGEAQGAREEKDVYDAVAELKKFKIIELEVSSDPSWSRRGISSFSSRTLEITKDVVVPFVVYEQRPDREGQASTYTLERDRFGKLYEARIGAS